MQPIIIVLIILVVLVFIALIKTIQVIPQASAAIVERFGRYTRTLNAGLNIVVPFIDSIRNPHEVQALRARKDFCLWTNAADDHLRFERSKARARENETTDFKEFLRLEKQELESNNPAGQQLIGLLCAIGALISPDQITGSRYPEEMARQAGR